MDLVNFHVVDVSRDGELMVIVNHGGSQSNLYTSDKVDQYEVDTIYEEGDDNNVSF